MKVLKLYKNESELIEKASKNHRDAQHQLYKKHAPKMLSICRFYIRDLQQAEEVLLNGFFKIFKQLDTFKNEGSFEGWMRKIIVRESISYLRKKKQLEFSAEDDVIFIGKESSDKPKKYDKRTLKDLVFSFGFNNAIIEGQSLENTPYKIGGSGFLELGHDWKTRIFNTSNFWRFKFGFSFQWNKFEIKNNNYLVNSNGSTSLEEFPSQLDKAKFRTTNLVFPFHLEFGPSKKIEKKDYFRYDTRKNLKIGLGAYAGVNIGSLQKLKYKIDGDRIKDKQKGVFDVNNFVYGLSSYVGIGSSALYVKYDLSPVFKNQSKKQNNISLGLRIDLD